MVRPKSKIVRLLGAVGSEKRRKCVSRGSTEELTKGL